MAGQEEARARVPLVFGIFVALLGPLGPWLHGALLCSSQLLSDHLAPFCWPWNHRFGDSFAGDAGALTLSDYPFGRDPPTTLFG